jgi:hypothetical protein
VDWGRRRHHHRHRKHDRLDNNGKFMLHLSQVVRNDLDDRAGTCIDPK